MLRFMPALCNVLGPESHLKLCTCCWQGRAFAVRTLRISEGVDLLSLWLA